jgi:hypothetical protein
MRHDLDRMFLLRSVGSSPDPNPKINVAEAVVGTWMGTSKWNQLQNLQRINRESPKGGTGQGSDGSKFSPMKLSDFAARAKFSRVSDPRVTVNRSRVSA